MSKTLYRSRTERVFGGVMGGLAAYLDQDPALLRVLAVVVALVTSGAAAIAYAIAWVVIPEEPADASAGPGTSYLQDWVGAGAAPEPPAPAPAPAPPHPGTEPPAPEPVPAPPHPGPEPTVHRVSDLAGPATGPIVPDGRRSQWRGGWWIGATLVVIGGLMLADRFVPRLDVVSLWPVAIIVIGILMILRRGEG